MATTTNDDAFHEIQLNGKQLVFLFMAVVVASVVIFLLGVLVGRGVRAERGPVEALAQPVAPATEGIIAPPPAGGAPASGFITNAGYPFVVRPRATDSASARWRSAATWMEKPSLAPLAGASDALSAGAWRAGAGAFGAGASCAASARGVGSVSAGGLLLARRFG